MGTEHMGTTHLKQSCALGGEFEWSFLSTLYKYCQLFEF